MHWYHLRPESICAPRLAFLLHLKHCGHHIDEPGIACRSRRDHRGKSQDATATSDQTWRDAILDRPCSSWPQRAHKDYPSQFKPKRPSSQTAKRGREKKGNDFKLPILRLFEVVCYAAWAYWYRNNIKKNYKIPLLGLFKWRVPEEVKFKLRPEGRKEPSLWKGWRWWWWWGWRKKGVTNAEG